MRDQTFEFKGHTCKVFQFAGIIIVEVWKDQRWVLPQDISSFTTTDRVELWAKGEEVLNEARRGS